MTPSSPVVASSSPNKGQLPDGHHSATKRLSNLTENIQASSKFEEKSNGPVVDHLKQQKSTQQPQGPASHLHVPYAFFSTGGGEFPARNPTDLRPLPIARSDSKLDTRQMINTLRALWPHQCSGIFARSSEGHVQWDVTWFFDEYDFHLLGGEFCYNLILTMQKENEAQAVCVARDWSERNKEYFPWMPNLHIGISAVFASRDRQIYGDEFLKQCLHLIKAAVEKTQTQPNEPASEQHPKDQQAMVQVPAVPQFQSAGFTVPMMVMPPRFQNGVPGPFIPYYSVAVLPPVEEITNSTQKAPVSPQSHENIAQIPSHMDRGAKRGRGSYRSRRGRSYTNVSQRSTSLSQSHSSTEPMTSPDMIQRQMSRSEEQKCTFQRNESSAARRFYSSPRDQSKSDNNSPNRCDEPMNNKGNGRISPSTPGPIASSGKFYKPDTPPQVYESIDPSITANLIRPRFLGRDVDDVLDLYMKVSTPHYDEKTVLRLVGNIAAIQKISKHVGSNTAFIKFYSTADVRKVLAHSPITYGGQTIFFSVPRKFSHQSLFPSAEFGSYHQPPVNKVVSSERTSSKLQARTPNTTPPRGSENKVTSLALKVHSAGCDKDEVIYSPQDARSCLNPGTEQPKVITPPRPQVPQKPTWAKVVTNAINAKSTPQQNVSRRTVSDPNLVKNAENAPNAAVEEPKLSVADYAATQQAKTKATHKQQASDGACGLKPSETEHSEKKGKELSHEFVNTSQSAHLDALNKEESKESTTHISASYPPISTEEQESRSGGRPTNIHSDETSKSFQKSCGPNPSVSNQLRVSGGAGGIRSQRTKDDGENKGSTQATEPGSGPYHSVTVQPTIFPSHGSKIRPQKPKNERNITESVSSSEFATDISSYEEKSSAKNDRDQIDSQDLFEKGKKKGQDEAELKASLPNQMALTSSRTLSSSTEISSYEVQAAHREETSKTEDKPPSDKLESDYQPLSHRKTSRSPNSHKKKQQQKRSPSHSRSSSPSQNRESCAKDSPGPNDLLPWMKEYEMTKEGIAEVTNKLQAAKLRQELEIIKKQLENLDNRYSQAYQKYLTGTKNVKKTARKSLVQAGCSQKEKCEELVLLHERIKSQRDFPLPDPPAYPALHKPTASEEVGPLGPKPVSQVAHKPFTPSSLVRNQDSVLNQHSNIVRVKGVDALFVLVEPRARGDSTTGHEIQDNEASPTVFGDDTESDEAICSPKSTLSPSFQSPPKSYAAAVSSVSSSFSTAPPSSFKAPHSHRMSCRSKSLPIDNTDPFADKKRKRQSGSGEWAVGPEGVWGERGLGIFADEGWG